jgi:hypothetical protein
MRTTKTQPIARNATDSPAAHDFLGVEALLSDEERGTRERVRSFVQAMIKPNVAGSPRPSSPTCWWRWRRAPSWPCTSAG